MVDLENKMLLCITLTTENPIPLSLQPFHFLTISFFLFAQSAEYDNKWKSRDRDEHISFYLTIFV